MRKTQSVNLAVLALMSAAATLLPAPAQAASPAPPAQLRVVDISFTWVKLAWEAPAGAAGTRTYEARLQPGLWQVHTIERAQSFGGLEAGTTYTASVRTVDTAGGLSPAVTISFSTPPRTQPAPAAPANLRPVVADGAVQGIAWDAVTHGAPLFYALHSGSTILAWTASTSITSFQLIHHECAVEPGSTHTLTVQAWTGDNHASPHSAPVTVTFPS